MLSAVAVVIAIAPDIDLQGRAAVEAGYLDGVRRAGAEPRVLEPDRVDELGRADALLVCGGAFDIPPEWYGQQRRARVDAARLERSLFERALVREAERLALPVLGICGGAQLMAVHRGGTLVQDLAAEWPGALDHERGSESDRTVHGVELASDSCIARWIGATSIQVNSTHHQSIDRPGRGVRVVGRAPDGVVEAIEDPQRAAWLGVQWHPEKLGDAHSLRLLAGFVDEARRQATQRS
jgi:putative glutamine amidotransferase